MGDPTWIGVDIGGTKVLVAEVDGSGAVLSSTQRATPDRGEAHDVLEDVVVDAVAEVATGRALVGVGIAAAGFVDADSERVVFAPHLAWRGADVRRRFADRLGVPVALDNDANCAALAEAAHGAARGATSALVVTLGTGIGGAFVVEGEVWRGASGMAGEFGHMQVVPDGLPCECGRRGCWEQYCSGRALTRLAGGEASSLGGPALVSAARAGTAEAVAAYAAVGTWLGRGLANLVAALDPEVVVVGGGAASAGDLLLQPAREVLAADLVGAAYRTPPPVLGAELGAVAGAVGAALLVQTLEPSSHGSRGYRGARTAR